MKAITSYTHVSDLKRLMVNARQAGREDVYWQAFERRRELEGMNYSEPLHRDFHATLAAYEELLEEKNGRKTPASYTRRKLKNKGVEQCLEDWAIDPKETDGFRILMQKGLTHLTGEYLVLKYPDSFSEAARVGAKNRLAKYDVSHSG